MLDKDSVAAGVYAMWQRRLFANTRERVVPASAARPAATTWSRPSASSTGCTRPTAASASTPPQARDALVAASLDEAVAELTKRFGPDMQAWKYGQERFHHALIRHPLSGVVNAATRAKLTVGPLPRGGDGTTISATGNGDNQTSAARSRSSPTRKTGTTRSASTRRDKSGNPDDPHYRDLFELWARGKYFTLAYSRKKVESVKESVTQLEPARTTQSATYTSLETRDSSRRRVHEPKVRRFEADRRAVETSDLVRLDGDAVALLQHVHMVLRSGPP